MMAESEFRRGVIAMTERISRRVFHNAPAQHPKNYSIHYPQVDNHVENLIRITGHSGGWPESPTKETAALVSSDSRILKVTKDE